MININKALAYRPGCGGCCWIEGCPVPNIAGARLCAACMSICPGAGNIPAGCCCGCGGGAG